MNDIGGLQVVAVLLVLVAIAIIVRSGIGSTMVEAWRIVAMILMALLYVPWGLLLLGTGLAIVFVWQWGGVFGWLIAGVLVYTGGNCLFGSLAGFVTTPPISDTGEGATTA